VSASPKYQHPYFIDICSLIGPAGSGKSQVSFILPDLSKLADGLEKILDTLTGQNTRASSGVNPGTTQVSAHRILGHRKYGEKLVLVDTPGFENRSKIYSEIFNLDSPGSENRSRTYRRILKLIKRWRKKRYFSIPVYAGVIIEVANLSSRLGPNDV